MRTETLSVGFADLADYADMVTVAGGIKALEVLQEGFLFVGDTVIGHGGKLRKYIGDTTLFTFEDPKAAITACLEIAQGFKRHVNSIDVFYNVGLATGPCLVIEIGHPSMLVEDVMGATVNKASHLSKHEAPKNKSHVAFCPATREFEK